MPGPFWDQQCGERGPLLTHAHDSKCTDGHTLDQCCHCGLQERNWKPPVMLQQVYPSVRKRNPNPKACFSFAFTVTGKCARCQQPEDDHPLLLTQPENGCGIDHNSINSKHLIGDGGWEWSRCPSCNAQVEPRFISGDGPKGSPDGKGRGSIGYRLERRLGFLRFEVENDTLGGLDDPDSWPLRHPEDE